MLSNKETLLLSSISYTDTNSNNNSRSSVNKSSYSESIIIEQYNNEKDISENDLWWITLMFKFALLPRKDSSKYFLYFNTFWCIYVLSVGFGTFIFLLYVKFYQKITNISLVFGAIWSIHSSIVFVSYSYKQRKPIDIIDILRDICSKPKHPLLKDHYSLNLPRTSRLPVIICLFLVFLNSIIVWSNFKVVTEDNFDLSDSTAWLVVYGIITYTLQMGWFMNIPFVFIPCFVLKHKVRAMLDMFHSKFHKSAGAGDGDGTSTSTNSSGPPVDLLGMMEVYTDLYNLNIKANSLLSCNLTLSLVLLAAVNIFTILAFILDSDIPSSVIFTWVVLNSGVLFTLGHSVADVEIMNKKLFLVLGDFPLTSDMPPAVLQQYQTFRSKIKYLPFGIRLFGTQHFVTFGLLISFSSTWLTVFTFIAAAFQISQAS